MGIIARNATSGMSSAATKIAAAITAGMNIGATTVTAITTDAATRSTGADVAIKH